MRLRPEQLARDLGTRLAPVYLISGDETLLVQECADAVRAACRRQGFGERQVFHAEGSFDWQHLAAETAALSLFAERKLIELRLPTGKPGDAGGQVIQAFCQQAVEDTVLLILCGKLDGAATRTRWYKAVDAAGVTVPVWPVDADHLPRWIEQRLRGAGLRASPEAIEILADRVQGNLLACAQEIEKLRLVSDDDVIDAAAMAARVGDSARFDIFGLAERGLAGETAAALRALGGLRQEGIEPQLILWSLTRELRSLCQCASRIAAGQSIEAALQSAGVWERRKPLMRAALQRIPSRRLHALMRLAQRIDKASKGASGDNPWHLLDQLVLGLSQAPQERQ